MSTWRTMVFRTALGALIGCGSAQSEDSAGSRRIQLPGEQEAAEAATQPPVVAETRVDLSHLMVTSSMGDHLCVALGREVRCGPYGDREGRLIQRWEFDAPIEAIDAVGGGVCVALANEGLRCWGCYRCWPAGARCEAECASEPEPVIDQPIRSLAREVAVTADGRLHLWRKGEGWSAGPELGGAVRMAAHTMTTVVYVTEDDRLWIADRRLENPFEFMGADVGRLQSLHGGARGVCGLTRDRRVECLMNPIGDAPFPSTLSDKGLFNVREVVGDFCSLDSRGRLQCWSLMAKRRVPEHNSSIDDSPRLIAESVEDVAQFGLFNLCWSMEDGRIRCNSEVQCTVLPHLLGPIEYVPADAREHCID